MAREKSAWRQRHGALPWFYSCLQSVDIEIAAVLMIFAITWRVCAPFTASEVRSSIWDHYWKDSQNHVMSFLLKLVILIRILCAKQSIFHEEDSSFSGNCSLIAEEFETLWGYYMREWQASRDTGIEPVGMLYQIMHEVDGKKPPLQVDQIPQPQSQSKASLAAATLPVISYPHPSRSKPGPNTGSSDPAGIVAIHFRVLSNDSHSNQKLTNFDPFARWRRNAMLKSLVVKCCSKGCIPGDFVAVAQEYSICPGFMS